MKNLHPERFAIVALLLCYLIIGICLYENIRGLLVVAFFMVVAVGLVMRNGRA